MLNSKVQFTIMAIWLWLQNLRKGNGFTCDTGIPPLWESPTTRCMFYFNWNCSRSKGEAVLLKRWIKDNTGIAFCDRNSNFTTTDDYQGRLEQYNENGFILREVKSKDAGYYTIVTMVVTINDANEEVHSSPIFLPSIPSCDPNRTAIYKHKSTNVSPCDGGQNPTFIGLLSAFGIIIILLIVIIIYLCCRYKMSKKLSNNDLTKSYHDSGGELRLLHRPS